MPRRSTAPDPGPRSDVALRRAAPADAEALHRLGVDVVAATYEPISPAYAAFTLAAFWAVDYLERSLAGGWHVVAETDDGIVGTATLGRAGDRAVMWKLYVHPDHHGAGLGSAMLAAVEEECDDDTLWLEYVDGNDRAAAFYLARGFVEDHRESSSRFPDRVWMRKEL